MCPKIKHILIIKKNKQVLQIENKNILMVTKKVR